MKWWQRNRTQYAWYKAHEHLNEIELKIANFYKNNYGKVDENPVLIPQVYMHYDPKDKKVREYYGNSSGLKFQRMDFLILYKGHRVIIEIDGKEHFENTEEYSRQCAYDREMRFLGYDVFRLGGHELTYNFDSTVSKFFKLLFEYLN